MQIKIKFTLNKKSLFKKSIIFKIARVNKNNFRIPNLRIGNFPKGSYVNRNVKIRESLIIMIMI